MTSNRVLVQKFGGTSVGTPAAREQVVGHVRRALDEGFRVAVVVSAMGRRGDPYATDTLLDLLRADGSVDPADYTLVFVTGEMLSTAVMSHTLKRAGLNAVGLTGAQARVFTDGHPTEAEILSIETCRLEALLDRGVVPVITGGQGIEHDTFDYNTLGRGASDTSGVALGAALRAEKVEIFTDVEGVATADPRIVSGAVTMPRVSFERMYEMARYGAKVVHPRAILTGWRAATPIVVRSTFSTTSGTWIGETAEDPSFTGIAVLARLTTAAVAGAIDAATLAVWEQRRLIMSLQDPDTGEVVLGAPEATQLERALAESGLVVRQGFGERTWVSVIGSTAAVVSRFPADTCRLAEAGARPSAREIARNRTTFVVEPTRAEAAVRILHQVYTHAG